ncbi:MAG: cbb3-type cytochrome c oxidase subunit 3, partial [Gammaproteobacteria bacterium]|nr:cbb3-type cytochrome c oxidase subunit 3 [Gammaproteobacteria bacterium]
MNSLMNYFHTDWEAMTTADWFGMIITVVVFLLMAGLYIYLPLPTNRDKLEAHRHRPSLD